MRKSKLLFTVGRIINDAVMIFLALTFAYFLRMHWFAFFDLTTPSPLTPYSTFLSDYALPIMGFLILVHSLYGLYNFGTDEKRWDEIRNLFWAFSAGFALVIVYFFFAKLHFFSRLIFGIAWVASFILMVGGRFLLRFFRYKGWQRGWGQVPILVLGSGKLAEQVVAFLKPNPKFKIIGILTEKRTTKTSLFGQKVLGNFTKLEDVLKRRRPSEVLLAADEASKNDVSHLARLTHAYQASFKFLPDEASLDLSAMEISTMGHHPLLKLKATRLDGWSSVIKSIVDRILALIILIILSPGFLVIAVLNKIDCFRAPVFYGSKRVGRNGQLFNCWKFRSMIPDADKKKTALLKKNQRKGGVLFKIKDDPRITPLGRVLRKWSIDELPQLWNVVIGDMSLIGPRPHLPEEVEKYSLDHTPLLCIKPGITGFTQINGHSNLSFEEEMKFELFYLKNWNIWLDVIIFFKSIGVVLRGRNN